MSWCPGQDNCKQEIAFPYDLVGLLVGRGLPSLVMDLKLMKLRSNLMITVELSNWAYLTKWIIMLHDCVNFVCFLVFFCFLSSFSCHLMWAFILKPMMSDWSIYGLLSKTLLLHTTMINFINYRHIQVGSWNIMGS